MIRPTTDDLPAGVIILASTRSANRDVMVWGLAIKNDSPSSLGSRRRENERRKKTRVRNCLHDT